MLVVAIIKIGASRDEHAVAIAAAQPVPDVVDLRDRRELLADFEWPCELPLLLREQSAGEDTGHIVAGAARHHSDDIRWRDPGTVRVARVSVAEDVAHPTRVFLADGDGLGCTFDTDGRPLGIGNEALFRFCHWLLRRRLRSRSIARPAFVGLGWTLATARL